ncbi:O-antigen ligase family protein [Spirosoma taeanense]|uniref:O-antigen ligase family protein n=1 Tax=Spirosoma taeanense TaxID=2735870 RepID=A0A6M5Y715_9BACT|nr:O-antigen ligase [Spirosoma taeanense]QJW88502.1 O-antigen ligase family protein [Spirosoma taeanense]
MLILINQTLVAGAVLSLITAITFPSYGLMGALQEGGFHEGAWKGVYTHKNTLGRLMVIYTLTAFTLHSIKPQKKYWLHISLSVFLIIMSRSSSALVLVIFVIGLGYILKTFQLKASSLIIVLLSVLSGLASGGYYMLNNYEVLFELLGKDPTLTGRTLLWEQIFVAVDKRPLFGHGFGGFWLGDHSASAIISQELNWEVPNAHNGFLDILLDLGYVGFVAFLILYVTKLSAYMMNYSLRREHLYGWGVMYMILFLVYNFVESNMLRQNNFLWILFIATLSSYDLIQVTTRKIRATTIKQQTVSINQFTRPVTIT